MSLNLKQMSYGAEHEFADASLYTSLPAGWYRDPEHTIVNSNGIAADPKGELWKFGCELNPTPTLDAGGQVQHLQWIRKKFPEAKVNYRSNLHIHIRVPGLIDDLQSLKRVQAYIHEHFPRVIDVLVPLPRPESADYPAPGEFEGALRRWRRRRVSHRTLLTPARLARQLTARTVGEFFALEPPSSRDGTKVLWHAQPRLAVSLRQLKQTDTVEFRHFPGTLSEKEMLAATVWCGKFLVAAINNDPIEPLLAWASQYSFPQFPRFCLWQENRFRATVHDGTLTRGQIANNIKRILAGEFDDV
jgi:hypothetical protein